MSKVESIEHEIEQLSPEKLVVFRAWYGTVDLKQMLKMESLMHWLSRHSAHTTLDDPPSFESSRLA
jgi:hypothetical protein